ncbi:hypothetical protein MCEMIH16_01046 [Caulobacteraceae bacterium]
MANSKVQFDEAATLATLAAVLKPLGGKSKLQFVTDKRTGARYCECHIKASKLVELGTVDVPLDPDEQPEYRANREIVADAQAFEQMKSDAILGRSFCNIVSEYSTDFEPSTPIKIIGGQHRFAAIEEALQEGINEYHGIKLYVALDKSQRLDVQLISNTNIAVSGDLIDRMRETERGPQLRNWCHKVGLLKSGEDFSAKRGRGGPISVQVARAFVANYFAGKAVKEAKFDSTDTTPELAPAGKAPTTWEALIAQTPSIWDDKGLAKAGQEFAKLVDAQRAAFAKAKGVPPDQPEKALNLAIVSAWAFVSGTLHGNAVRLNRHFALAQAAGKDPLNAKALAAGRHKTDPQQYRGLGYRTDPKERGRLVELFFLQAEKGEGIGKANIELAVKKYHAKQANLDVMSS